MALSGFTDDLERFKYAGLPILPEKDSYSIGLPNGSVTSDLPGGLTKSQVQFFNMPYTVNVKYVALDAFKIDFIISFLTRHVGQKFIASLAIESSNIDEYVVQYVRDLSVKKTGFNGEISFTLQVDPVIDRCFEQMIADFGPCIGNPEPIFCYTDMAVRALP